MMLILASNSPRRRQLLEIAGWDYTLLPSAIDEQRFENESPASYVLRLAQQKAQAAVNHLPAASSNALILAADTAVVDGQTILGKPADARQAEQMLRQLRARTHQVYTSLALLDSISGSHRDDVCVTQVTLRDYTDEEIQAYIASGDPYDKAGAYAIQHPTFKPVAALQGCAANVMGLPICHLARLMQACQQPAPRPVAQVCQSALGFDCLIYRQING